MDRPLISIITPVYNSEKYLKECINSVLEQTDSRWELILIDDGSTDSSGRICDEYAGVYPRIKVIHKNNEGQFASRVRGISVAGGRYCVGLDSDDYIDKDYVRKLGSILEERDYDIVSFRIVTVGSGDETNPIIDHACGDYDREKYYEYVCSSTDHSFCNKLIRSDILLASWYGKVPLQARFSEDHILITPALCMARSIHVSDEILYYYRRNDESVTSCYTAKRIIDYLDSTACIIEILKYYSVATSHVLFLEFKSLVSSVGYCLKRAYLSDQIDKKEAEVIRKHPMYRELKRFERLEYITIDTYIIMKLFRLRFDWIISSIYRGGEC